MKPKKIPAAGDPFAEVFENMPRHLHTGQQVQVLRD